MLQQFDIDILAPEQSSAQRRAEELGRSLTALAVAHFRCPLRPSSGIVARQAEDLGLDERDFAVVHVSVDRRRVALAAIPSRLWHDSDAMALFRELKAACAILGEHVVLVPEGFINRQPRLDNAMLMAGSRHIVVPIGDRMSILEHLLENGSATLSELASGLRHPDPVNAIMAMVTGGLLDMNLDRPIMPTTIVTMAGAR
jgi:hypothetical protein